MSENSFKPSGVSMSLDHQFEDLALKSPVIIDKYGLRLFMSHKSRSRFDKNKLNSLFFHLGNDKLQRL